MVVLCYLLLSATTLQSDATNHLVKSFTPYHHLAENYP